MQDAKALKEAVTVICRRYNTTADTQGGLAANIDDENENQKSLEEIMRQKAFLERSVSALRNQMEKVKQNHKMEIMRKVKENKVFLQQIDDLKKDLKKAKEYKVPAHLVPTLGSRKNSLTDRWKRNQLSFVKLSLPTVDLTLCHMGLSEKLADIM